MTKYSSHIWWTNEVYSVRYFASVHHAQTFLIALLNLMKYTTQQNKLLNLTKYQQPNYVLIFF